MALKVIMIIIRCLQKLTPRLLLLCISHNINMGQIQDLSMWVKSGNSYIYAKGHIQWEYLYLPRIYSVTVSVTV